MKKQWLLPLIGVMFLTACSSNGKYVSRGASYKTLTYGSVTAKEPVTLGGSQTGIGGYIGGAAAIENATSRSFLGLVVRGLAGSIAGNTVEEVVTRQKGMLYSIEMKNGNDIEVASTVKDLKVGSCVLISNAGKQRVKVSEAPQTKCGSASKVVAST